MEPSSKSSQLNVEHTAKHQMACHIRERVRVRKHHSTVIRDHGVHAIQKNHEILQRALSGRLVILWRVQNPRHGNVNRETRPDDDRRNNYKREAGVEIPVPVETLQMEYFDHLEKDAHEIRTNVATNARHIR